MEKIMNKYKDAGFKLTPQRMAILEYLEGNREHPSAEEIYRAIRDHFPTMSFATVYNTLDMLVRKGKVIELTIDPGKKRFDPGVSPHHHFICSKCRRIDDIFEEFDVRFDSGRGKKYRVTGHHIEFYGICPSCLEHERAH